MAVIDDAVKHVIDSNKAKAKRDQVKMENEIKDFVDKCNVFDLQKIYSIVKSLKRKHDFYF